MKLHGPDGLKLILDHGDSDTPAIVELRGETSTYPCAIGTGMVDDMWELTARQMTWLEAQSDAVDAAYAAARAGMPEYQ